VGASSPWRIDFQGNLEPLAAFEFFQSDISLRALGQIQDGRVTSMAFSPLGPCCNSNSTASPSFSER
jgi:hypothetical protein